MVVEQQYQCPYCQGLLAIDLHAMGSQAFPCPHCQQTLSFEAPSATPSQKEHHPSQSSGTIRCPHCQHRSRLPDKVVGRRAKLRCRKCHQVYDVTPDNTSPSPATPQGHGVTPPTVTGPQVSPPPTIAPPRKPPRTVAAPQVSPSPTIAASADLETESMILEQTVRDLASLMDQLEEAYTDENQQVQSLMQQKLDVFSRQIQSFKSQFGNCDFAKRLDSAFYVFCAGLKFYSESSWHGVYDDANSFLMRAMGGLMAKRHEGQSGQEAFGLLEKARAIQDSALIHLFKADVYWRSGNKSAAIWELDYVIANFPDEQEEYIEARQKKDHILTSRGHG